MKKHREQTGVTDGTTYGRTELGTVESYTLLCYFTKKHHQRLGRKGEGWKCAGEQG